MKNKLVLLVVVAAIAVVYNSFFSDWHKARKIQILLAVYPAGILPGTSSDTMVFCLDKPYPLRSIKVVPAEEARTNKFAHALWHMVAGDATQPVKSFRYGAAIPGMQPEVAAAPPEPLDADKRYSLEVETAKGLKGEITFQPPPP
jgi:hypothetical protein